MMMNKRVKVLISLIAIFLVCIITMWKLIPPFGEESQKFFDRVDVPVSKVIKYRMEVSNKKNVLISKPSFLLAMPVDLSRHRITKISVSETYKKVVDNIGNTSIEIGLKKLVPYETKLIDVSVVLDIYSKKPKAINDTSTEYLNPEKFVESTSLEITRQASLLKASSSIETARNTYNWVVEYLSDSGFIEEDRGALFALKYRKADCTGYMYLYGALLRANGIPARMMSGFIVKSNKRLSIKDYHNWVEVYLDGIWHIVDPQNKVFLDKDSNYIAMRIVDNSKKSLFDNAQQLFKTDSDVKLNMN